MAIDKNVKMETILTLLITLIGLTGLTFGIINVDKSKFGSQTLSGESLREMISKPSLPPLGPRGERYFIGSKTYPLFTEVTFDPFDVKVGEKQAVAIKVQNSDPVKSVSVFLNTDNKITKYDLALSQGTDLNGVWRGSWIVDDSRVKIYSFTFHAVDSTGKKSSIDFSFGKEFRK